MKSSSARSFATNALVVGLLGLSSSAMAASDWSYTFGGTNGGDATTWYDGNPAKAPNLTISGAYVENAKTSDGSPTNSGTASNNTAKWTTTGDPATLEYYSGGGLGMSSDGSSTPNHAIDNAGVVTTYKKNGQGQTVVDQQGTPGNTEAVLLKFDSAVVLNTLTLGYINTDADISLFRYIGSVAPVLSNTIATAAEMLAAGWQLVGNYADLSTSASAVNSGNLASSWWLVSAYNSNFGTTVAKDFNANGDGLTQGNDFFKLNTVTASAAPVPEPASLALLAIGLLGVAGSRRRAAKAAAA